MDYGEPYSLRNRLNTSVLLVAYGAFAILIIVSEFTVFEILFDLSDYFYAYYYDLVLLLLVIASLSLFGARVNDHIRIQKCII